MKKSLIAVASIVLFSTSVAVAKDDKASDSDGRARHAALDKNKDGKITRDEARAHADELFDRLDANKDGVVDETEAKNGRGHQGRGHGPGEKSEGRGPQGRFEKMDKNGDGKVSQQEAAAFGKNRFKERDTNKDGFLTRDELRPKHQESREGK